MFSSRKRSRLPTAMNVGGSQSAVVAVLHFRSAHHEAASVYVQDRRKRILDLARSIAQNADCGSAETALDVDFSDVEIGNVRRRRGVGRLENEGSPFCRASFVSRGFGRRSRASRSSGSTTSILLMAVDVLLKRSNSFDQADVRIVNPPTIVPQSLFTSNAPRREYCCSPWASE